MPYRFSLLLLFLLSAVTADAKQPNILFIFSDDHATAAIGAYGSTINQTPNLDRIAAEGAVFRNSFCANSICGPSRACILTGKHSHVNGFLRNGDRFDGSQVTFPKLMQDAGYQTALIGKWHLGTDPTGFDHWEVLPGQGSYYNPDLLQMGGGKKRYEGYVTDIITDNALAWLKEKRDPEKPFVMMCQHKAPHRNWSSPPRYYDLYADIEVPEPDTLFDDYRGRTGLLHQSEMSIDDHMSWAHDMKFHGENLFPKNFSGAHKNNEYTRMTAEQKAAWDAKFEPLNEAFIAKMKAGELSDKDVVRWKYQRYIKEYLRCVQAVDDSVGSLLGYLDEAGLADDTIVIYSSDQGFYLGEHGWFDKRWMFEQSLQMPFLIRWPGVIEPSVDSTALIQNIDYAPTFLDVAGAEIPAAIQGRSMVEMFKNQGEPSAAWRDAIYYAYYETAAVHNVPIHDGVRTDRYKLMWFPKTREYNLFDLETDPDEMTSVHNKLGYVSVFSGLQKRLRDLRSLYGVNTAVIPQTRGDEESWQKRDRQITANAKQGRNVKLAFIGDSITQGWEGAGKKIWDEFYGNRNAINLGIGGDRTEHVIWRLQNGNLGNIQPDVAVVMLGTNNTGHLDQDPDEVAAGVTEILRILNEKLPETKIVLQGIFPRGDGPLDLKRLNNIAINERIAKLADGDRVQYLDIGSEFLEADGTISETVSGDKLHLTAEGYRRWAQSLEPTLKELGL